MNAPLKAKPPKAQFVWDDPLLLGGQLAEDERMVRDAAHAYCQEKLAPRILEAFRQEHTDPAMMGRVMSMYSLVFFVAMPVGYAQAGFVTSLFGPQTTLVASGLVAAALGLACVTWLRPVRTLA